MRGACRLVISDCGRDGVSIEATNANWYLIDAKNTAVIHTVVQNSQDL